MAKKLPWWVDDSFLIQDGDPLEVRVGEEFGVLPSDYSPFFKLGPIVANNYSCFVYNGISGDSIVFQNSKKRNYTPMFYPQSSKEIRFPDLPGVVKIEKITPDSILLHYISNSKKS